MELFLALLSLFVPPVWKLFSNNTINTKNSDNGRSYRRTITDASCGVVRFKRETIEEREWTNRKD